MPTVSRTEGGVTTIACLEDRGWSWNIPMRDDIVSSGIVAARDYLYRDTRDPAEIFQREIRNNKWVEDHLSQGGSLGEYWVNLVGRQYEELMGAMGELAELPATLTHGRVA